jgi:Type II secretion system (T2SS), protein M
MTGRDRLVLMGIAVLAILAGGWLLLVSPERKEAAAAESKIETARTQLQTAQAQAASERSAEARYASAYVSVVKLGKAVPPEQEVPSLVYELEQASHQHSIDFNSITSSSTASSSSTSSSSTSSSSTSSSSSASGAAAATAAPAAFTQMPFTFVFKGSFFGLAHLLGQIDGLARTTTANGGSAKTSDTSASTPTGVQVNGRLLTIQGVSLAIESQGGSSAKSSNSASELAATITATAYVLPASQGLTGGATAAGPAGSSAAAPAASAASSNTPANPAVIEGRP